MSHRLAWLTAETGLDSFPPLEDALDDPDGLLAAGGDLSVSRLLSAYELGIFPWYEEGQPVLWWSPNPRTLLPSAEFHCSRSLRRTLRQQPFKISFNRAFSKVVGACAEARLGQSGTWITTEMQTAYARLFERGFAFSVECWLEDDLVGGVYGVVIDKMVYGESMFSRVTDASKTALFVLCQHMVAFDMPWLDCQVASPHLASLGARSVPRPEFQAVLREQVRGRRPGGAQFPDGELRPLNFL